MAQNNRNTGAPPPANDAATKLAEARARVTELSADLSANEVRLGAATGQLTALSAGLLARELVSAADADQDGFDPVVTALSAIDAQAVELTAARKSLSAQAGATTRTKNQLAKAKAELQNIPGKPRALGILKGDPLKPADLLARIAAASTAEIVGSDGRVEIKGIESLTIEGGELAPSFRVLGGGLALALPEFIVHGPSDGNKRRGGVSLEGWGLFLDGELVAYRKRDGGSLMLGAGQAYNLAGDVLL